MSANQSFLDLTRTGIEMMEWGSKRDGDFEKTLETG